jgi:hypothetical protein
MSRTRLPHRCVSETLFVDSRGPSPISGSLLSYDRLLVSDGGRGNASGHLAAALDMGVAAMTAASDISAEELREAWRAVANAKLAEFRKQCWRLAGLARRGIVEKQAAVNRLWEVALAHALVRALGEDRIEAILSDAFADAVVPPLPSELVT